MCFLGFNLASLLFVCLFFLGFNSFLFSSDGFKVSGDEQVDENVPFLVSLEGASEDHDFTGQHPEDSCDRLGNSVVAGNNDINEVEGSVGVAESDAGDVDIRSFDNGLVIALGVSNNQESGFLELLGDLIGEGSGDPSGGSGSCASGVLSELVDGSLSVFFGADDDDFRKVGDGGDDASCEFDSFVGFIGLEDVVAGLVAVFNEGFHVIVDFFGSEVNLGEGGVTEAARSLRTSLDCRSVAIATKYIK